MRITKNNIKDIITTTTGPVVWTGNWNWYRSRIYRSR